jgi:hypothetical protein
VRKMRVKKRKKKDFGRKEMKNGNKERRRQVFRVLS